MKRRSREINIFSMSALDLFASALGAFMLITVVLFPFFPNTGDSPERVAEVRAEIAEQIDQLEASLAASITQIESVEQELGACTTTLDTIEDEFENCQAALQQTFVLVVISWGTSDDVDLHVIDPRGNEYYYADDSFPGSDAALEEDNTTGPGNEIWLSPTAIPGDYEVYANMFSKRDSSPADVRGSLLHQNGRLDIPTTTISTDGDKPLLIRFNVNSEGTVTVN